MFRFPCILAILSLSYALGQTAPKLTFEVASIRPAAPVDGPAFMFKMSGGPGTVDPGQITYSNVTMRQFFWAAFGLSQPYLISGPSWIDKEKYDMVAKVPQGATKEQVREMFQNLLIERFHLAYHRETRDLQGYEIAVAGGGLKIKETGEPEGTTSTNPAAVPGRIGLVKGKDGMMEPAPGYVGLVSLPTTPGAERYVGRGQPIGALASVLKNVLGCAVVDKTGLTAKYDFSLNYTRDERTSANFIPATPGSLPELNPAGPPDLFTAMQEQLGLKLESKKLPTEVLVIDRLEKVATEN